MKYTEEHEWLTIDDQVVTVGITKFAASELGDIVFIELPEVGQQVSKGEEIVVIESVKTASDISAPLDGEIVEVNDAVVDDPSLVNADALDAWFFKMRIDDAAAYEGLMDEDAYQEMIG